MESGQSAPESLRERFLWFPFLLGFSCIPEVEVLGRLMAADLLFLAGAFLALVDRPARPLPAAIYTLLILGSVWLLGAVFTDLYRDSTVADWARGQSRIVITLAGIAFLSAQAARDPDWVPCFWLGLVIGLGLKPFLIEQWGFADNPWKFGLAEAALGLVLILIERLRPEGHVRWLAGVIGIGGLAIVSLFQDFRSQFALLAVIAVALVLREPIRRVFFEKGVRLLPLAVAALPACAFIWSISWTYETLAEEGALGREAQLKYYAQSRLDLPLIVAGRNELLVSYRAIEDSPIIGHGSWARDPDYVKELIYLLERRGMFVTPTLRQQDLIPSHSYIMSAWVDHGILAVPFWLAVLAVLIGAILHCLAGNPRHREMILCISVLLLWDVLFSPFGSTERILLAASCVIAVFARSPASGEQPAPGVRGRWPIMRSSVLPSVSRSGRDG